MKKDILTTIDERLRTNPKVSPIVYNYVNRTSKTTLTTGVPFFLFISLQLHVQNEGNRRNGCRYAVLQGFEKNKRNGKVAQNGAK